MIILSSLLCLIILQLLRNPLCGDNSQGKHLPLKQTLLPAGFTSNISELSYIAQQYVDCVFNMIMGVRTFMWKKCTFEKYYFTPQLDSPQIFQSFLSLFNKPCSMCTVCFDHGNQNIDVKKCTFEKYNFTPHLVLAVPQMFQSFHCTTSNNGPNMYFWSVLCVTI